MARGLTADLKHKASAMLGFAGLALIAAPAFAQTAPAPKPAPKPAQAAPAAPAPAAPAPAAAPVQTGIKVALKAAPDQPDWFKVCGDDPSVQKVVCYTTRDFVAENNQPVMAVAVYAVKDDQRRFVRFLVPLTFMIPPGIRFSAEGMSPVNARFQICLQQGCFVEGELNDAAIASLKKSPMVRIDMQNQVGQEVNFEVPLAGFAKAFDGPGIDQQTLQKMQEEAARAQASGQQPGAAPNPAAEELKKKGEELARQRQQQTAPKQP